LFIEKKIVIDVINHLIINDNLTRTIYVVMTMSPEAPRVPLAILAAFLCMLFVMHVIWTWFILKVFVRIFTQGQEVRIYGNWFILKTHTNGSKHSYVMVGCCPPPPSPPFKQAADVLSKSDSAEMQEEKITRLVKGRESKTMSVNHQRTA
jgi:hypothetical protein